MRVAIIGSRNAAIQAPEDYLPLDTTEIITGGARGIDTDAIACAQRLCIPYRVFLPDYARYGRAAPLRRNDTIIEESDIILAFWDSCSNGTAYVIRKCKKLHKPLRVYLPNNSDGWNLQDEITTETPSTQK